MCIRDRDITISGGPLNFDVNENENINSLKWYVVSGVNISCLLYTSDAADERSSVDLGGRRIIKKKKKTDHMYMTRMYNTEISNEDNRRKNM